MQNSLKTQGKLQFRALHCNPCAPHRGFERRHAKIIKNWCKMKKISQKARNQMIPKGSPLGEGEGEGEERIGQQRQHPRPPPLMEKCGRWCNHSKQALARQVANTATADNGGHAHREMRPLVQPQQAGTGTSGRPYGHCRQW
jgi:hypothetical protein